MGELALLGAGHRHALQLHLLSLSPQDRCQRFGLALSDDRVMAWSRQRPWATEQWWGAWSRPHAGLLGALQLAPTGHPEVWELALTVTAPARRQGVGTALLAAATLNGHTPQMRTLVCQHGHPTVARMAQRLGHGVRAQACEPRLWIDLAAARRSPHRTDSWDAMAFGESGSLTPGTGSVAAVC